MLPYPVSNISPTIPNLPSPSTTRAFIVTGPPHTLRGLMITTPQIPYSKPSSMFDSSLSPFRSAILATLSASSRITPRGRRAANPGYHTTDGECTNGLLGVYSNFVSSRIGSQEPVLDEDEDEPHVRTTSSVRAGGARSEHHCWKR